MRALLVVLLLAGCGTLDSASAGARDRAEILQVIHDTCAAYRRSDPARMAELVAEDFTLTDADGVITTRADDIEAARTGAIRYEIFENYDMAVRLYRDSAVVTGKTRVSGSAGGTRFSAIFQFTDTMVRRDGRWWFAASHISRLP